MSCNYKYGKMELPSRLSHFVYDAGGERVWKLSGQVEQLSLNGGMLIDMATLTNKTLYTSPYMVITDQEYTKHYYAGTQRIASKTCAERSRSIGLGSHITSKSTQ
jgi:hypothetical protein